MPDKLTTGMDDEQYQVFLRQQLATMMRKYPVWPMDTSNPKEWYPGQGGEASIFQGPVSTIDPIGAISPAGAQRSIGTIRKIGDNAMAKWSWSEWAGNAKKALKGIPSKEIANLKSITSDMSGFSGPRGSFGRNVFDFNLPPTISVNAEYGGFIFGDPKKKITQVLGHELTHNRQFYPQRNIIDQYTSGLMRVLSARHGELIQKEGAQARKLIKGDSLIDRIKGFIGTVKMEKKAYWQDPKEIHARDFTKKLSPYYDKKAGTVVIDDKQWDNLYRQSMSDTLKHVKESWGSEYDDTVKWYHDSLNKNTQKQRWAEEIGFAQGSARDPFGDMWGKYNQMLDDGLPF